MPRGCYTGVGMNLHGASRDWDIDPDSMYARLLRNAAHIRRFTIRNTSTSGWAVLDERDSQVLKSILYDDWHRVERAKAAFAIEALTLSDSGWIES